MNVYDFDDTIYHGDSTRHFFFWCFRHHPKTLLYIPLFGYATLRYYAFHIGTKTEFKERMYRFLKVIDGEEDVEALLAGKARRDQRVLSKESSG